MNGVGVSTSNKYEDYEKLAHLIAKGEQIPKILRPLLLELYQTSLEADPEDLSNLLPKEYELTYASKSRKEEIISSTKAAPLQKVRTFDSGEKFDDDWVNKLIFGDNLKVLKSLADDSEVRGKVKLIYIDPPFATKKDFLKDSVKAYSDKVTGSAFIEFTRSRIILMKELLAPDGAIFVHLDSKKGHYIKIILDEIFGEHNFRNEIIWGYNGGGVPKNAFARKHDTIFYYVNNDSAIFNIQYQPYSESSQGLITARGGTSIDGKARDLERGGHMTDWWGDINSLQTFSTERLKYPTQKPEALLARIIDSASNPGDIVMDAFSGSGTTLAVAEKLNRKWIGIDCGKLSIYTIQSRMLGLREEIGNKGRVLKHKPFCLFNAGLYDYKAVESMDFSAYREFILKLFQVRDKKHEINGLEVDGLIKNRSVLLWKHKNEKSLTINEDYLQSLHKALGGRGGNIFYVIAPNSAISFPEDAKVIGDTEYRFLRIPQSIIDELIASKGSSLQQPRSAGNINDTVEALAFDFIKTPEVKRTLKLVKPKLDDLFNQDSRLGLVKISRFVSKGLGKPEVAESAEFEYLSMVMIDKNYNGQIFNLCEVIFSDKIENGEVFFEFENIGKKLMIIYVDIYGNEFREVIEVTDFKGSK